MGVGETSSLSMDKIDLMKNKQLTPTNHCITNITEDFKQVLGNRYTVCRTLVDLQNAIDIVGHKIFIAKQDYSVNRAPTKTSSNPTCLILNNMF